MIGQLCISEDAVGGAWVGRLRPGPEDAAEVADVSSDNTRRYGYLGWLRVNFEKTKTQTQVLLQGILS